MTAEGVPRLAEREAAWEATLGAARAKGFGGDLIPRYFFFEAGWEARDLEVRALTEALRKVVARGGETPPYSQMALDMWMTARAALRVPVPVEGEADR